MLDFSVEIPPFSVGGSTSTQKISISEGKTVFDLNNSIREKIQKEKSVFDFTDYFLYNRSKKQLIKEDEFVENIPKNQLTIRIIPYPITIKTKSNTIIFDADYSVPVFKLFEEILKSFHKSLLGGNLHEQIWVLKEENSKQEVQHKLSLLEQNIGKNTTLTLKKRKKEYIKFLKSLIPKGKKEKKEYFKIFGVSLQTLNQRWMRDIPSVVLDCIKVIRDKGMDSEGIFRLSGAASNIKKLSEMFDSSEKPDLSNVPINDVAGVLKLFFRSLPEAPLTDNFYEVFLWISRECSNCSKSQKINFVNGLISALPHTHQPVVFFLLQFLNDLSKNSKQTKMGTENLATIFGPLLLNCSDREESLRDTPTINDITDFLISNMKEFSPFFNVPSPYFQSTQEFLKSPKSGFRNLGKIVTQKKKYCGFGKAIKDNYDGIFNFEKDDFIFITKKNNDWWKKENNSNTDSDKDSQLWEGECKNESGVFSTEKIKLLATFPQTEEDEDHFHFFIKQKSEAAFSPLMERKQRKSVQQKQENNANKLMEEMLGDLIQTKDDSTLNLDEKKERSGYLDDVFENIKIPNKCVSLDDAEMERLKKGNKKKKKKGGSYISGLKKNKRKGSSDIQKKSHEKHTKKNSKRHSHSPSRRHSRSSSHSPRTSKDIDSNNEKESKFAEKLMEKLQEKQYNVIVEDEMSSLQKKKQEEDITNELIQHIHIENNTEIIDSIKKEPFNLEKGNIENQRNSNNSKQNKKLKKNSNVRKPSVTLQKTESSNFEVTQIIQEDIETEQNSITQENINQNTIPNEESNITDLDSIIQENINQKNIVDNNENDQTSEIKEQPKIEDLVANQLMEEMMYSDVISELKEPKLNVEVSKTEMAAEDLLETLILEPRQNEEEKLASKLMEEMLSVDESSQENLNELEDSEIEDKLLEEIMETEEEEREIFLENLM